jgi:hypothetical protein
MRSTKNLHWLRKSPCIYWLLCTFFLSPLCWAAGPPPFILVQPLSTSVQLQDSASFQVIASSGTTMTFQWLKNGTNISGATQNTYTIASVQASDAGLYSVTIVNGGGSVTSSGATLTVLLPPTITTQPQNLAVAVGGTVAFSVGATGTGSLSHQWYLNGSQLGNANGARTANYSKSGAATTDAGNYTVKVQNSYGSATSAVATLTVVTAPSITTQPQSQTVVLGSNASLSVTASGSTAVYQWNFKGAPLSGATNALLALTNIQTNQAGGYIVVLTNLAGSVTSAMATVTVIIPPAIVTQPQTQTVLAGQNAAFSVNATGTGPLSYHWNFNGTPLTGATNSVLILSNVLTGAKGNYTLVVTNSAGSITSSVATLAVTIPNFMLSCSGGAGLGMTSNGFAFQFSAPIGSSYTILATTDLVNWSPIATNPVNISPVIFTDQASTNQFQRFYQVILQ